MRSPIMLITEENTLESCKWLCPYCMYETFSHYTPYTEIHEHMINCTEFQIDKIESILNTKDEN